MTCERHSLPADRCPACAAARRPRIDRPDHRTSTVEAAAAFERMRHPDPVRINGIPYHPDDVPSRDEL